MALTSFRFFAFLFVFAILYFSVPKKWQVWVLLAGNLYFYLQSGPLYLIYLLFTSTVTWLAGRTIERESANYKHDSAQTDSKEEKARLRKASARKKQILSAWGSVTVLAVWIILKYGNFLIENINLLGLNLPKLNAIVPLGMSFYTFFAVGYLTDIYRTKYTAEPNFFRYLTFVSYFPHMIQGPFSRYDRLGATLFQPHHLAWDRMTSALSRILWGYVKKTLIADKLGIAVNAVFADYGSYWGTQILAAILLYGIQIYADFSGYMDIVCGISKFFGIELEENFRQPYFSRSIDEFWRRWHITLGGWFRDYLFYPISMGKAAQKLGKAARKRFGPLAGKLIPSFIALFFVWTATGLWHGANWTFLIWGYLNMAVILFSMRCEPLYAKLRRFFRINENHPLWILFQIGRTFLLVCFTRFFSRAASLQAAMGMLARIPAALNRKLILTPLKFFPQMETRWIFVALVYTIALIIVDILAERGQWETVKKRCPMLLRNLIYVIMIYSLLLFAGNGENLEANFIYANF